MAALVIALIIAIALGAVFWQRDEPRREQALQTSLDTIQDFSPALTLFGADGATGVAIDPNSRAVGLMQAGRPAKRAEAERVLGADLYQDGRRIGSVARSSPQAQTRLDALRERSPAPLEPRSPQGEITRWAGVKRVELRVWLDDDRAPAHDVRLLDREVQETDAVYRDAVAAGEGWLRQLDALLR